MVANDLEADGRPGAPNLFRLTVAGRCLKLHGMDEARQRVMRKFLALPGDKQQKLSDLMRGLTRRKAEREAKPENAGKPVTHTKLWGGYAKKRMKVVEGEK